jgi:hypothetical protein
VRMKGGKRGGRKEESISSGTEDMDLGCHYYSDFDGDSELPDSSTDVDNIESA